MNNKPTIICPCPIPKRLLTSNNWIARNDSSNVNALLQPDNFLFSPRLKYHEKTKGQVIVKELISENNCYCRCKSKKSLKPRYFKRPNRCVSYMESSRGENVEDDDLRRESLACICEEVGEKDNVDARARLKLRQAQSLPAEVSFKNTEQRNKYEEYRQMQEEKFQEKLFEDKEREEFEQLQSEYGSKDKFNSRSSAGGDSNIDTILSTQKYGTSASSQFINAQFPESDYNTKSSSENYQNYKPKLRSLPDFRKEHYFETHNIGKMAEITGNPSKDDHTCVHQFQLDDRWIPEPLNKDSFGRSTCKICDKVMEGSRINLSSGYLLTESDELRRSKIKNYAESYESGFTPTTINLGRGKSRIEVVLKDKDIEKFGSYINRVKRPVFRNSLALRHQRLRMI